MATKVKQSTISNKRSLDTADEHSVPSKRQTTSEAPTVVHLKRSKDVILQDCDVYIGRAMFRGGWKLRQSKWYNPFTLKNSGSRSQIVKKYEDYILGKPELLDCLPELVGKSLGCWCAPEACHGDVLRRLVIERVLSAQPASK
eukprot:TRINITY_DN13123_c0_g1_i1.p1 TRINITY_DN13123_c0_g1~~TRINITY_DN13123_c0_g1_i1.p1  ORF type:complete len:143 (-),score=18.39 TRINITY_DN13123_c0_g1_i1:97-525(-)